MYLPLIAPNHTLDSIHDLVWPWLAMVVDYAQHSGIQRYHTEYMK